MVPRSVLRRLILVVMALVVAIAAPPGWAQPPGPLSEPPSVVSTSAGPVRVVPIKGLVHPWALTFLPGGDILVTEQNQATLRLIHDVVLDPTPITGLLPGITSQRRDRAGVDVTVHPRFSENRLVYVSYWKRNPDADHLRTAVVIRGRVAS